MRARWYSTHLRRFLSEDPAGFSGGENFYAYADNAPIISVDPTGLQSYQLPPQLNQDPEFTRGYWMGAGAAVPAGLGITAAAFTGPIVGGAALSAGFNMTNQLSQRAINPNAQFSGTSVAVSAGTGAVLSGAFSAVGALVANGFKTTTMSIVASRAGAELSGSGPGLHVVYQAGGESAHAAGNQFFAMTTRPLSNQAFAAYANDAYSVFQLPVANAAAVTQAGLPAVSCVTGAFSAFLRGWTNSIGTGIGLGAGAAYSGANK
jgi:hypothetical protein